MKPNSGLDQLLQLAQLGAVMAQQQQAQQDIQLRQMMAQLGYQQNEATREMQGQQFQQGQELASQNAESENQHRQQQLAMQKSGFDASREEAKNAEKIAQRSYLAQLATKGLMQRQNAQARMDATRDRAVAEKRGEREKEGMELEGLFKLAQLFSVDPRAEDIYKQFASRLGATIPPNPNAEAQALDAQLRTKAAGKKETIQDKLRARLNEKLQ